MPHHDRVLPLRRGLNAGSDSGCSSVCAFVITTMSVGHMRESFRRIHYCILRADAPTCKDRQRTMWAAELNIPDAAPSRQMFQSRASSWTLRATIQGKHWRSDGESNTYQQATASACSKTSLHLLKWSATGDQYVALHVSSMHLTALRMVATSGGVDLN